MFFFVKTLFFGENMFFGGNMIFFLVKMLQKFTPTHLVMTTESSIYLINVAGNNKIVGALHE